jgi:cytochrome c biogenesis protein CcmG, thiol:disulfide interchange protein DsbE|tara:strand:+ start:3045 stop:3566 length:522 start_codon:yes stop_codon:yes gene_type:complete
MKNKFILFITIIFLSFCFIIFYKGLGTSNTYLPKISKMRDIPTFNAKDFNSSAYLSSEEVFEEDSFYIVNIWASWCAPCRTEHPLLMQLSKYKSVQLIGLNYRDNFESAKKFISEFGNPYSKILIDKDGTLGVEFGAYGVPETFLISKNKYIIKKIIGPINQEIVNEIKLIIQ